MIFVILILYNTLCVTELKRYSPSLPPHTECIKKVIDDFYDLRSNTWILTFDKVNHQLVKHLQVRGHPLVISSNLRNCTQLYNFWARIDNYIIDTSEETDLRNILLKLSKLNSWNSHAKFLVYNNHFLANETMKGIETLVELLWYHGIYRFTVVTPDVNRTRTSNFYTWYFYKCNKGYDYTKIILLGQCRRRTFFTNTDLFQIEIPKTFNNCILNVGAVVWPPYVMPPEKRLANSDSYLIKEGLEIRLIQVIAQKLQMGTQYTISEKALNWGVLYNNGTATGLMAKLREKKMDVAISSLTPTSARLKYFEYSKSYYFESFSWCVPHAAMHSSWRKILDVIDYKLWIPLIISFIATSLLLFAISYLKKNEHFYKNYQNCLQNTFSIVLGVSMKHLPKTYHVKLVLGFWILFSFNFEVLYETQLISVLTSPTYDKQIQSLDDILESGLKIQFMQNVLSYYDLNSSFNKQIDDLALKCSEMADCFSNVAYKRDAAFCLSSSYTNYIKKSYITKDNIPLIYCFDSHLANYPVLMLMKKGFPLRQIINDIIFHLVEGGFVDFWANEVFTHKWKNEEQSLDVLHKNVFINIKEMLSAFACLGAGLTLAFLVFIGEIVVFLFKLWRAKRIVVLQEQYVE